MQCRTHAYGDCEEVVGKARGLPDGTQPESSAP